MPKITVISPSVRPQGLEIVKQALTYQDFKDFEWIVCTPQKMESEVREVLHDCIFKYVGMPPLQKWQVWDLNASYNRMIEQSKGELIVSWQDYTFGDADILGRLYAHYLRDNNKLVSVLGNKYPDDEFDIPAWIDPRYDIDVPTWMEVEWNLCSCPKDLLYKIGGFDEGADKFFGMDGFGVNHRLSKIGARFGLEKESQTYSLFHGRVKDWDRLNGLNGPYGERVDELKKIGKWPILDYLKVKKVE